MIDFSLLVTHWGIASFLFILFLFLVYLVPRLFFTAYFKSYWEAKKQSELFTKTLNKEEKSNDKTNKSN